MTLLAKTEVPPDRRDARPLIAGWIVSVVAHLALLAIFAWQWETPARVEVRAGQSSLEMTFVSIAAPTEVAPNPSPDQDQAAPPSEDLAMPDEPMASVSPEEIPVVAKPEYPTPPLVPAKTIASILPTKSPSAPASPPRRRSVSTAPPSTERSSTPAGGAPSGARPDYRQNAPPAYPEEARRAGEHGVVVLRVQVSATGAAGSVTLAKTSGFPRLDQAARQAVTHWTFRPATKGGLAVSSEVAVPVRFELQGR